MKFAWRENRTAAISVKVDYRDAEAHKLLSEQLLTMLDSVNPARAIVVLCIGTDRSTGDSLGPLIGTLLKKREPAGFSLYGTLQDPVHALNLQETLQLIENRYRKPFIIAIDACLGQFASVGTIQLGSGPMRPGAGVNKQLPPVGDIHITGIVNVGGFMEYLVLQNTRLSLVMEMADIIAACLHRSLSLRHEAASCSTLNR